VSTVALVTDGAGGGDSIAGIYAGDLEGAWSASVAQAERLHTTWVDRPYNRVISCAMPIYSELWTAGKAMYKLEPAVADGGELVIYAPHLSTVSAVHGEDIFAVGYHVLAYFLDQWERFSHVPLAVLAHSTHVKGAGTFDVATSTEHPRIEVKLASQISPDDCARLNLGYVDPSSVDLSAGSSGGGDGAGGGTLVVPRSGEMLYRVKPAAL
jgi:nickel-dependent lactate racemase